MFNKGRQVLVDQTNCPAGWTAIHDTCIKAIKVEKMMQIRDAESMCKAHNASLLNLKEAGYRCIISVRHWAKASLPHVITYASMYSIRMSPWSRLSGLEVSGHTPLTAVLDYVSRVAGGGELILPVTSPDGKCWTIEFTRLQHAFMPVDKRMLKNWGLRPRKCDSDVTVNMLVCEMPAKPVTYKCREHHFICPDGTCILADYVCDDVTDCVDNADEVGCSGRLHQDDIDIPCSAAGIEVLLSQDTMSQTERKNTMVEITSFCDGIITCDASFELLLCEQMYNHRQNAIALQNMNNINNNTNFLLDVNFIIQYTSIKSTMVATIIQSEKKEYYKAFTILAKENLTYSVKYPYNISSYNDIGYNFSNKRGIENSKSKHSVLKGFELLTVDEQQLFNPISIACPPDRDVILFIVDNACNYTRRVPRCYKQNCVDINCPGFIKCTQHIVHANYLRIDSNNHIYTWDTTVPQKNTVYFSIISQPDISLVYLPLISSKKAKVIDINLICQYEKHNYPYQISSCATVSCPGKFKCPGSYCIPITYICDGENDCIFGEDEVHCDKLSCPGLLKCRGETRCIAEDQICDGNQDCTFSFDDEVFCDHCPEFCVCSAYKLSCFVNNTFNSTQSNILRMYKALVLKGLQYILNMQLVPFSIIYLEVAKCGMSRVDNADSPPGLSNIMFANFSGNPILDITFVSFLCFKSLISIDFSMTKIFIIEKRTFQDHKHLRLVDFRGAPLQSIALLPFAQAGRFVMVNFRDISWINIYFSPYKETNNYYKLKVYVSDYAMCCLLSDHIDCTSNNPTVSCHQIMLNSMRLYYRILTAIVSVTITITLSHNIWLSLKNTKSIAYFALIINGNLAEFILAIYIYGILIADSMVIIVYRLILNVPCNLLANSIAISFLTSTILHGIRSVFVLLKIRYPFKHQCRFLLHTGKYSITTWILGILSSPFVLSQIIFSWEKEELHISWNKFCNPFFLRTLPSYFDMALRKKEYMLNIVQLVVISVDCIILSCSTLCCLGFLIPVLSQRSSSETLKKHLNNIIKSIMFPFMLQFLLRMVIWVYIFAQRYHNLQDIIIILIPVRVILTCGSYIVLR